jgi:hypothetical protein
MKFSLFVIITALSGILLGGCASSKKPALSHGDSSYSQQGPSSRTPGESAARVAGSSKKSSRRISGKTHSDLVEEYKNRMEANAKRYKKEAKMAEKPQYSDPSYFGHKKKPKKRSLKKRKLCKECGIVH